MCIHVVLNNTNIAKHTVKFIAKNETRELSLLVYVAFGFPSGKVGGAKRDPEVLEHHGKTRVDCGVQLVIKFCR